MLTPQRRQWGAMLVTASILAGCGGGSDDSVAAPPSSVSAAGAGSAPATTARPSAIVSPEVSLEVGSGARKPIAPDDFQRHQMKAFRGGGHDYANVSLKLLISAIGPKALLDHLEDFKQSTRDPGESAAAGQLIDLIHQAYNAFTRVDTEAFLQALQELAPFNRRNAAGDLEFRVLNHYPFTPPQQEQELEKFLLLISQLFRLHTLPGWTFGIDETYVRQGEERTRPSEGHGVQMFQPVQLSQINPVDPASFNLQKIVDLLHADQEALMQWNEADAGLSAVQVRRQVSIADLEHLKRLTISLRGGSSLRTVYSLDDPVTLPAINRKTGQKIVLTLTPKESIAWDQRRYVIRIKDHDGRWITHQDGLVSPTDEDENEQPGKLINFAVTGVAPAP